MFQLRCNKEEHDDHLYYNLEVIHGILNTNLDLCGLMSYQSMWLFTLEFPGPTTTK